MHIHLYHPGWLAEPNGADNTWGRYGESVTDWLQRSTVPRAQAARRFLRKSIDEMPPSVRDYFVEALRNKWDSTFLELILARTIQLLGGQFCMEQQNTDNKRPDFHADFDGHQVTIEVISPAFEIKADKERSQDAPLLELINRNAPRGWSISVITLQRHFI